MRRLVNFAVPFSVGAFLCQYLLPEQWQSFAAAAALLLGLAVACLWKGKRLAAALAAFGLAAGILWSWSYRQMFFLPAEELVGREDVVTLQVEQYPEETDYGSRTVVRVLERGLRGKAVYYSGSEALTLCPGDRVTAAVKYYSAAVMGGKESSYYPSRGIFLRLYDQGQQVEVTPGDGGALRYLPQRLGRLLRESIRQHFAAPEAGLIQALLLGEREDLSVKSENDLAETGLMHLTAVSGLHCGFLIGLLGILLGRRRKLTAFLGYPVLLLYVLVVGASPSVVRSCVMLGCMLLAPLLDREGDAPTALAAAALLILAGNPYAAASLSFQLSFAAVAGLLIVTPRLYAALAGKGKAKKSFAHRLRILLAGTLSASLGAMAFTAPISAAAFGTLALVAPLANLAVLWCMPLLFVSAALVSVAAILLPAAAYLAFLPQLLARYVLWAAGLLAKLPWHAVYFTTPAMSVWLIYVCALLLICWFSRERRRKYLLAAFLAAAGLLLAKAMPALSLAGAELTVVAVDVGQGATTLLHAGGHTVLVDCGSQYSLRGAGNAVADTMDQYGWRKLDSVVLTHCHEDHAGGVEELLSRVEVGQILLPQMQDNTSQAELQRELLAAAGACGVKTVFVQEERKLALGPAEIKVFPPLSQGDINEEGLAILCTAEDFDVLMTGDMNTATERLLAETYPLPDIEVLLVGHHGSKYATSEELLAAVTPEIGIISVGENQYGHPTPEAMDRMLWRGMRLYRTDLQGSVVVRAGQ